MSYQFTRIPSPANNPIMPCVHCETQTRNRVRIKKPTEPSEDSDEDEDEDEDEDSTKSIEYEEVATCYCCMILIKRGEKPQTLASRIPDKPTVEEKAVIAKGEKIPKREAALILIRAWDQKRRAEGYDSLPKIERKKMQRMARIYGYKQMPFKSIRARNVRD